MGSRVHTLLLATSNAHKVAEIRELLGGLPVDILTLRDRPPVPEPEETGATFEENARQKARYYDTCLSSSSDPDVLTVAEDSGLVIDALNGEPGIHSARYVRQDASYAEKFEAIYRRLAETPERPRSARFVCAVAVVHGGRVRFEATGTIEGEIAPEPRGAAGFGYDPIFYYPPYRRTLAEVTSAEKLRVAHRGAAIMRLADWLRARPGS